LYIICGNSRAVETASEIANRIKRGKRKKVNNTRHKSGGKNRNRNFKEETPQHKDKRTQAISCERGAGGERRRERRLRILV